MSGKLNKLKTGDAILFCGNSSLALFLRTFISSDWNHVGIAVRFNEKMEITLDNTGDLYILDTNGCERYDPTIGENIVGTGFSKFEWSLGRYNRIKARILRDEFRTPALIKLTEEFVKLAKENKFPSSSLPFFSVWLGIQLHDKNLEMFCSQLMANYYMYVVGPQYESITGVPLDNLSTLFGSNAPNSDDMFQPAHYAAEKSPLASIFHYEEELICTIPGDLLFIILQPLVVTLFVFVLIYYSLIPSS
jgi:hypothetical protein